MLKYHICGAPNLPLGTPPFWYDEINVKYGVQFTNEFVKNWKRILDDFFIHGQNQNKNY